MTIKQKLDFLINGHLLIDSFLDEKEVKELSDVLELNYHSHLQKLMKRNSKVCGKFVEKKETELNDQEIKEILKKCSNESNINLDRSSRIWVNYDKDGKIEKPIFEGELMKKFALLAADLLNLNTGIRIYKQIIEIEEPEEYEFLNKPHPFKSKLMLSPFDTNHFITIFCPINRGLDLNDSVPLYLNQTHSNVNAYHRKKGIEINDPFNYKYKLGDCSVSHGFLFQSNSYNMGTQTRYGLSLSLFDRDAQISMWEFWRPQLFCKDWLKRAYSQKEILNTHEKRLPTILNLDKKNEKEETNDDLEKFMSDFLE